MEICANRIEEFMFNLAYDSTDVRKALSREEIVKNTYILFHENSMEFPWNFQIPTCIIIASLIQKTEYIELGEGSIFSLSSIPKLKFTIIS